MQNITDSRFVCGMIKATSDAWRGNERNGGNLTLRLDGEADIAPFATNFHENHAISR